SDPLHHRDQGARDADARRARRLGRRVRLRPVPLAGAPAPPAASAAAACAPAACAAARRVGGRRPLVHAGRRPPLLAAPVAQRRGGALRGAAPPAFRPCAAEAPRRVYSRRRRVEPTPSPLDPASSTALAGPPVPALADALALPAAALTLLAEMGPAGVAAGLGALLLLLALSALFSGSEVALFSITPAEREALAEGDESHAARRVLRLLERARALLVSLVLLDTLARVVAGILSSTPAPERAEALGWCA